MGVQVEGCVKIYVYIDLYIHMLLYFYCYTVDFHVNN